MISSSTHSFVVSAVRKALQEKMGFIDTTDRDYNLKELAFSFYRRETYGAHAEDFGAHSLGRREFLKNIIHGESKVDGYCYDIELARTKKTVGVLVGALGNRDDSLEGYCHVQLNRGETFEFVQYKDPKQIQEIMFQSRCLGRTMIRHNGVTIGECHAIGYRQSLVTKMESEWDLFFAGKPFGKIIRPEITRWNNLKIIRPDGSHLPLILAFHVGFADSVKAMWHILTLRAFRGKPWPNPDWIVPSAVHPHLAPEEVVFYFSISLLFRAYFGLDDHSGF